jgi:RloB-like protein
VGKSSDSFGRAAAKFKPQPRVLVLCEDSKSALNYLVEASRHFRSNTIVKVAHVGRTDPLGIVEEAISNPNRKKFDKVYCVIDRDAHESFDTAIKRAKQHKDFVQIVSSYPCYEFWLFLHFKFTRAPINAVGNRSAGARMAKMLRAQPGMAGYEKGLAASVFSQLIDRLPIARRNAARTQKAAIDEQQMNPSTEMDVLIDALERLGTPLLVTR